MSCYVQISESVSSLEFPRPRRLTRDWDEETTRSQTDDFGSNLYRPGDRLIVEQVARIAAIGRCPEPPPRSPGWPAGPPIIGAAKPHHIDDAVAALDFVLTDPEMQQLESVYEPHRPAGF
jgi:aryl-alcohol dehydrogenase-like predicted oxidoreductase